MAIRVIKCCSINRYSNRVLCHDQCGAIGTKMYRTNCYQNNCHPDYGKEISPARFIVESGVRGMKELHESGQGMTLQVGDRPPSKS